MASCVLLLLLLLWCCCRWCRCLRQLFSFYEQCEKKKSCESTSRENEFFVFSFAAVGISFCVSSILLLLGGLILR